MAERLSLEDLIEGLAGAVVEAQRRIESYQIQNFQRYFDEDNRPRKIDIRLPSLDPRDEQDKYVLYRVPLLPIVASSLLRIKDVKVSFDAELAGLTGEISEKEPKTGEEEGAADNSGGAETKKSVSVDIRRGMFRRRTGKVHVVLKVEGRELSEGMARLIDRLIQSQGDVIPK